MRTASNIKNIIRSTRSVTYDAIDSNTETALQAAFVNIFTGNTDNIEDELDAVGFTIYNYTTINNNAYYLIVENSSYNRGYGCFAIKKVITRTRPLMVDAPHKFHDLYTGDILVDWFENSDVDALYWNNTHRDNADQNA